MKSMLCASVYSHTRSNPKKNPLRPPATATKKQHTPQFVPALSILPTRLRISYLSSPLSSKTSSATTSINNENAGRTYSHLLQILPHHRRPQFKSLLPPRHWRRRQLPQSRTFETVEQQYSIKLQPPASPTYGPFHAGILQQRHWWCRQRP